MRTFCFFLRDLGVLTFSPCKQRPKRNNTTRVHHVNTRLIYISVCVAWRLHIATVKQIRSVLCIRTKRPRGSILTDTNTDVHSVREHISTHTHAQTHLCAMKIKRHLLRWHLLQSHTPPPLLHPSCHNCKNSTNTHAHSRIFTLTHTHHFSCSHLFPLTMALSSWCPCAHSLPQLACNVLWVRVYVRIWCV